MKKISPIVIYLVLFIILLLSVSSGFIFGSVKISFKEIIDAIFKENGNSSVKSILFELRLPRILAAALAGAGLAVAGLLLQTATDNDLCSPNVIGVNAGAGFAVMLCMCLFPMYFALIPFLAFIGAAITALTVLGISFSTYERSSKSNVVLAGVAVAALLNAGISLLSQLFPDVLSSYATFSAGGFSNIYLNDLFIPSIIIIAGIIVAWAISSKLNLLCLGDDIAASLGVSVKFLRFFALLLASAICGAVVSYAGLLGFVGLIVPHISRKLIGHDIRLYLPVCVLFGASLVILSDLAARIIFAPAELPAGILMAALGAPFFIYLLFKRRV